MNSIAKTEESVEEKTEMKKETVEKISVKEEETKAQKVEEKEIETKKDRAEESGPEGNLTIVETKRRRTIVDIIVTTSVTGKERYFTFSSVCY